jgi:hypothetical protein
MDLPRRKRLRLEAGVYAEPGRAFSVTIGTAPRGPVFADVAFGEECIRLLRRRCAETATSCYAHCLMPDHVHLLVGVGERLSLSAFVGSWKSLCAVARGKRAKSCRSPSALLVPVSSQAQRGIPYSIRTVACRVRAPRRAGSSGRWRKGRASPRPYGTSLVTRSGTDPCAPSDPPACSRRPSRTRAASRRARSRGTATAGADSCS